MERPRSQPLSLTCHDPHVRRRPPTAERRSSPIVKPRGVGVGHMKGLGKKELSSPLSSTHILYNQPLVGGLSGQPTPGTRIANVSLAGGSTVQSDSELCSLKRSRPTPSSSCYRNAPFNHVAHVVSVSTRPRTVYSTSIAFGLI